MTPTPAQAVRRSRSNYVNAEERRIIAHALYHARKMYSLLLREARTDSGIRACSAAIIRIDALAVKLSIADLVTRV